MPIYPLVHTSYRCWHWLFYHTLRFTFTDKAHGWYT